MKVSVRNQRLRLWLSVSCGAPREIIFVTALTTNEKEEFLMPLVAAQYPVVETTQRVHLTTLLDMLLIFSHWVVLTADIASTWIRDFSSSPLILMTEASVLTDLFWIWSMQFPACLSLWSMSPPFFAQVFESAVLVAELVWQPFVVTPRFIIVWKDMLSAQSACLGSQSPENRPMRRDLFDQGCRLEPFILHQRWNESGKLKITVFCGYLRCSSKSKDQCRTTVAT